MVSFEDLKGKLGRYCIVVFRDGFTFIDRLIGWETNKEGLFLLFEEMGWIDTEVVSSIENRAEV